MGLRCDIIHCKRMTIQSIRGVLTAVSGTVVSMHTVGQYGNLMIGRDCCPTAIVMMFELFIIVLHENRKDWETNFEHMPMHI